MMAGTKRTPLSRQYRPSITPRAVALFAEMRALVCTCEPRDWSGEYWKHEPCNACRQWWTLHARLHRELGARLWDWPVIESPLSVCPYPAGSAAAKDWTPDERAREMWKLLEQAALAARRRVSTVQAPSPPEPVLP
jgi:hypothetical protein